MTTTLQVNGMTCNHCAGTVKQALLAVKGVSAVEVTLPDQAKVVHDDATPTAALAAAVDAAGYTASV